MHVVKQYFNKKSNIAYFIALVSLALSPWSYHAWQLLNSDGVFYLQIAYHVNQGSLMNGFQIYNWPFLAVMIASIQKITHFSYANSAFLLQAPLFGLIALFYVKIIELLGGNKRTLWLSGLVLLGFIPMVQYRLDIFRDPGYWAFYLASAYYLLSYVNNSKLLYALLWFFCALTAALFRIEGTVLWLTAPIVILFVFDFGHLGKRILHYLKFYLPLLACALAALLFFWQTTIHTLLSVYHDAHIIIKSHMGHVFFWQKLMTGVHALSQNVLSEKAKSDSPFIILWAGLNAYFIYKFIWVINIVNFTWLVSALVKKAVPFTKNNGLVILWLLFLSLAIPYNFLLQELFVNTRYLSSAVLLALTLVPFALNFAFEYPRLSLAKIWSKNREKMHRYLNLKNFALLYIALTSLIIIYCAEHTHIKNTFLGPVKTGDWLSEHKQQLKYGCTSHVSLQFIISDLSTLNEKHYGKNDISGLWEPSRNCQYIVFRSNARNFHQIKTLEQQPGWRLYEVLPYHNREESTYIYVNTRFKE